jgi:hypothetical protein
VCREDEGEEGGLEYNEGESAGSPEITRRLSATPDSNENPGDGSVEEKDVTRSVFGGGAVRVISCMASLFRAMLDARGGPALRRKILTVMRKVRQLKLAELKGQTYLHLG